MGDYKLFEILEIGKTFTTWIKTHLGSDDAIEGVDFLPLKEERTGGHEMIFVCM